MKTNQVWSRHKQALSLEKSEIRTGQEELHIPHTKVIRSVSLARDTPSAQKRCNCISTDEHSHTTVFGCSPPLNPQTKAKVLELIASGVTKPRKIMAQLESHRLPRISKVQLNNLKTRLNAKTTDLDH